MLFIVIGGIGGALIPYLGESFYLYNELVFYPCLSLFKDLWHGRFFDSGYGIIPWKSGNTKDHHKLIKMQTSDHEIQATTKNTSGRGIILKGSL